MQRREAFVISVLVVWGFIFALGLAAPARAEEPALPAEIQAEYDRGLAAANVKAWDVAIKHFEEASRKLDYAPPYLYPPLLFNLALAHDKAGHELAAIGWFWRYLGTTPDAANAADVRTEIISLEVRMEAKLRKLLDAGADVLRRSRGVGFSVEPFFAEFGDVDTALALSEVNQSNFDKKSTRDFMMQYFVVGAAQRGDFERATQALMDINNQREIQCWFAILNIASRIGNQEATQKLVQLIEAKSFSPAKYPGSCGYQSDEYFGWQAGFSFIRTERDFSRAEKWLEKFKDVNSPIELYSSLSLTYVDAFAIGDALRIIDRISKLPKDNRSDWTATINLLDATSTIALVHLASGKLREARAAANSWKQILQRSSNRVEIGKLDSIVRDGIRIEVILGRNAEARKLAISYATTKTEDWEKVAAFNDILVVETLAGQTEQISATRESAKSSVKELDRLKVSDFVLANWRARAMILQGKSAAIILAEGCPQGCSDDVLKNIFDLAMRQHDLETAEKAVSKIYTQIPKMQSLSTLVAELIVSKRKEDAVKIMAAAEVEFAKQMIGLAGRKVSGDAYFAMARIYQMLGNTKGAASATIQGFVFRNWDRLVPNFGGIDLAADLKSQQAENEKKKYQENPFAQVAYKWVSPFNQIKGFEKTLDEQLATINARK